MITSDRLKQLLTYDPATGIFTRKVLAGGQMPGSKAGSLDAYGYVCIAVDGRNYKAHRLAWLYMHGAWPTCDLDHKNEVKTDNRIDNLREITKKKNTWNCSNARSNNTSGLRGASKHKCGFQASICINGKQMYLGLFSNAELAHKSYRAAKRRLHVI